MLAVNDDASRISALANDLALLVASTRLKPSIQLCAVVFTLASLTETYRDGTALTSEEAKAAIVSFYDMAIAQMKTPVKDTKDVN